MSDIRFNRWLHQSGTGGVYQDGSGRVGIGSSVPSEALTVVGNINASGKVGVGTDTAISLAQLEVYVNTSDSGGIVQVVQDGTGDASIDFQLKDTQEYTLGIDNSDSDKFKLSGTAGLGSDDFVTVTTSGNVGVGTDNPLRKLSVNGVIESLGEVSAGSTSEGGQLMLRAPSQQLSGTKYRYGMDVGFGTATFARDQDTNVSGIRFLREDDSTGANGLTLASIGQDGIMSLPYLPCFRARHNNNTLTTGTLVYNIVDTNIGSHYNGTNGRFTAPITGFYSFKAHTLIQNATGGEARMAFYRNGSSASLGAINIIQKGANQWETIHVNGDFYLNAGDYITAQMTQNPTTVYSDSNYNGFSGFLVG